MRTNNISQYSAYQTSFQWGLVDRTVPRKIADAIKKAPNIKTIRKKYWIRFVNYNTTEDPYNRPFLHLKIKLPKKFKDILYDLLDLVGLRRAKEAKCDQPYTGHDGANIVEQIERLTIADIQRIMKQTEENEIRALKGTPPEGVKTY